MKRTLLIALVAIGLFSCRQSTQHPQDVSDEIRRDADVQKYAQLQAQESDLIRSGQIDFLSPQARKERVEARSKGKLKEYFASKKLPNGSPLQKLETSIAFYFGRAYGKFVQKQGVALADFRRILLEEVQANRSIIHLQNSQK